jgi:cyclopropane fatty-acyl-phospholipid synthase-like methyltransferase
VIKYRLVQFGLFYEPNFDFHLFDSANYYLKKSENSLHQKILKLKWEKDWAVAELGGNDGVMSSIIAEQVAHVTCVDMSLPKSAGKANPVQFNLDQDFTEVLGKKKFDRVIALDVIEHLGQPEVSMGRIFDIMKPGSIILASTGNIAYILTRFSLLFAQFNYGKRGILDLTHKRLFTVYSFKKLLTQSGFRIEKVQFFGPPILDMVGQGGVLRMLDSVCSRLAQIWPTLFAYQFLVTAKRMDGVDDIFERTFVEEKTGNVIFEPRFHESTLRQ